MQRKWESGRYVIDQVPSGGNVRTRAGDVLQLQRFQANTNALYHLQSKGWQRLLSWQSRILPERQDPRLCWGAVLLSLCL